MAIERWDHDAWDWPAIRQRCTIEARRLLRRRQDAEDVVQEALARAWRNRRSCRTPDAPLPWCLQITRNEAFRRMARLRATGADSLDDTRDALEAAVASEAERTLLKVDVCRALDDLTPHERLLISLRYVEDCSHPEIATRLEIPEATARVQLHRARKRLRMLLADET